MVSKDNVSKSSDKRRFPRAEERIPVRLQLSSGKKHFEAICYTADISLSGVFFGGADFFLKAGLELDSEFRMPDDERTVRARGVIVREVRIDPRRPSRGGVTGFAMRFVEYYDDAKTVLASSFLARQLDGFIEEYLRRRTQKLKTEREQLQDVIVAWEVSRIDYGITELDLLRPGKKR